MSSNKKGNLLAVAYDAGGAETLSSYLKQKKQEYVSLQCLVKGPARNIFLKKGLGKYIVNISKSRKAVISKRIDLLITATSWNSSLEIRFLKLAKDNNIPTISVLEHWVCYKERFGYPSLDWRENLPDRIWVFDCLAEKLAKKEFGGTTKISRKPNFYFKELKSEYKNISTKKDKRHFNVLFLSEPITERKIPVNQEIKKSEKDVATRLIELLVSLKHTRPASLTIRRHPSEDNTKYSSLLRDNINNGGFRVFLSNPRNSSLIENIRRADIVVGIQSPALIIASLFKDAISCCDKLPRWFIKYNIKHAGNNFSGLRSLLIKELR